MSTAPAPARLHVLLARDAPVGLVIRRGPSKEVAVLKWDRETDEFTLGQWLRARIYERRSDLSPDGKYFLYFALNGKWGDESKGAFTAVSRAPFLKAINFYPQGETWGGGGLWTSATTFWKDERARVYKPLHESDEISIDAGFQPTVIGNGESFGAYYPRLVRDGWTHVEKFERKKLGCWAFLFTLFRQERGPAVFEPFDAFEKPVGGGWTLRSLWATLRKAGTRTCISSYEGRS